MVELGVAAESQKNPVWCDSCGLYIVLNEISAILNRPLTSVHQNLLSLITCISETLCQSLCQFIDVENISLLSLSLCFQSIIFLPLAHTASLLLVVQFTNSQCLAGAGVHTETTGLCLVLICVSVWVFKRFILSFRLLCVCIFMHFAYIYIYMYMCVSLPAQAWD